MTKSKLVKFTSGLTLSDAARRLAERERLAARRTSPVIAVVPCPKIRFEDLGSADMALKRMLIDTPEEWDEYLHAYTCSRCGGAHLGHSYG